MEAVMRNGNRIFGKLAETFVRIGIAVPIILNEPEKAQVIDDDTAIEPEEGLVEVKSAKIIDKPKKAQKKSSPSKRGRKPVKK